MWKRKQHYLPFPIWAICLYKDYVIISGGGGGKQFGICNMLVLYKLAKKLTNKVTEEDTGSDLVTSIQWLQSADLVVASIQKDILVLRVSSQQFEKLLRVNCEVSKSLGQVKATQDAKKLVSGGEEGIVKVWSLKSSPVELQKLSQFDCGSGVNGLDICSKYIAVSCKDKTCKILTQQGTLLFSLGFSTSKVQNMLFKGCGFSGKEDELYTLQTVPRGSSYITKWSIKKNFQPIDSVEVHHSTCCTLKISNSGSYCAVGTSEGHVKVLRTKDLSTLYSKLLFEMPVTTFDFNSKETRFLTGSADYAYSYETISRSILTKTISVVVIATLAYLIQLFLIK